MQYKNGYVYLEDKFLEETFGVKIPTEFPRWRKNQVKRINFIWWMTTGEIIQYPEFITHKNKNKTDDRFENLGKTKHKFDFTEEEKKEHYKMLKQKFKGKLMHPTTPEMTKKISLANKGKVRTDEMKQKLSLSLKQAVKEGRLKIRYGKDNPSWKGGILTLGGYIYIKYETTKEKYPNLPDNFPFYSSKRKKDNYVKRANLIWWTNTGEIIEKPYFIHHINGNKTDDRFENLEKTNRSEHAKKHAKEYLEKRKQKLDY